MTIQGRIAAPQVEKDMRAFLKKQGLSLKTLNLGDALTAMSQFRATAAAYPVLNPCGDGLAFDAHLGTKDRGTRFEIAINRLLRLPPEDEGASRWPAIRLWLRLQYKMDMTVIQYLSRHSTYGVGQSFVTWSPSDHEEFAQQIKGSDAFVTFRGVAPTEVRLSADFWEYRRHNPTPDPLAEPWWGIFDVV
ncbi:hypothetical protein ACDW_10150 [Acidovorax sp. DW039]|uniref:hypothetical protein n=1 Tax=Acidovorax sp. DW039 TaxID=3095606 RepID=UPI003085DC23|nr:hypothetical protein ACDW_10150 [Acidovorax sp. DW039]